MSKERKITKFGDISMLLPTITISVMLLGLAACGIVWLLNQ